MLNSTLVHSVSGSSENALYDSGASQENIVDEGDYACIKDNPAAALPAKKQQKKPVCPVNNLYSLPVKKSDREVPTVGRHAMMNLCDEASTINPIYDSATA